MIEFAWPLVEAKKSCGNELLLALDADELFVTCTGGGGGSVRIGK